MTTATLQNKMTDIVARLDKACGKSFIAENQKCTKSPVAARSGNLSLAKTAIGLAPAGIALAASLQTSNPRTKILLGVAGATMAVATLGALKIAAEVESSNLPPDKIPPYRPPAGLYDTFQPGDLIYHGVDFMGGKKAHFGVYVGKINGEHSIFDTAGDSERFGSIAQVRSLNDTGGSSFQRASRVSKDRPAPSTEQLFKIIDQVKGKHVDWTGFEQNCETYARTIVNDLPRSTGSKNVSAVTAKITRILVDTMIQKLAPGYKKTALKQSKVAKVVKQTMNQDAAMNPKAQAAQILSPIFNGRPLTVMSVALSPEGNPTGVFRGEPRPGQTHYYTFNMGQKVQFRRIMGKTDGMDEACGCTECKKHKRTKAECECGGKTDGITKTHKVMREFKNGELTTHGKPVTNRKQAIAIALSEQSRVKKKKRPKVDSVDLSSLERNGDGKVYYQGRWWKPNDPIESTAKGKKKMVLAVKDGKVKIVHFGADGYGHNYSEEARKSYMARSAGIKGTDDKHSANYWARKVLWAGKGGSVSQPKGDARLDKKCGASGIPDNAKCTKAEGVAAAQPKKGTRERNYEAAMIKGERWRKKNPKKAFLLGLTLAIGIHVASQKLNQVITDRLAEHYIKKDFGVSPEEARRVRKTVQETYRTQGSRAAENYFNQWAAQAQQEQQAKRQKDGPPIQVDKNWHKTLGVSPNASAAEIKAAFRKKAKETHPDVGGRANDFAKVQKAWESAKALNKVKRGDSIEMEWFLKRMDAEFAMA